MKLTTLLPSRRRATQAVLVAAGVAAAFAVPIGSTPARGQGAPTSQPAAGEPRSFDAVDADIRKTISKLESALGDPKVLADLEKRKEVAPRAVPVLSKLVGLFDELVRVKPETKPDVAAVRAQFTTFLAALGDDGGTRRLAAMAGSAEADEAVLGRAGQLMVRWLDTSRDGVAQAKVSDEVEALYKAHPESQPLKEQIAAMADLGAASPAAADRMKSLVSVEGKPLTIAGKTVEGKDFTTADWKGKVVLVDFWATWCGPCKAELPNVKEMYEKYHGQGLEILGVSNDQSTDDLVKFLADDKKMPWPQLFDAAAAAKGDWNPITQGFGINGIPTMYLIDRHGVLRSVEARGNMRDLIPKLLDEK